MAEEQLIRVSIITVNLNNAQGLEKTILSVIGQDNKEFEFVVIDGGSTDGSREIIERYQNKITYWISERDRGVYNAMNKGIEIAKGEYCYFLNSGDTFVDSAVLSSVIPQFYNKDICAGNMIHGGINTLEHGMKKISFFDFFIGSIYHQSAFIKRTLFALVGKYNEDLKIVSDWEFFLKALFIHQCSYQYFDTSIACYETGGLSFQNPTRNAEERKSVLIRYFPLFIEDYEELLKYKASDFAGIYKTMNRSPLIKVPLKVGLNIYRFVRFKIFRKSY